MNVLIALPVIVPLGAAASTVILRRTSHRRVVTFATIAVHLAAAGSLMAATSDGQVFAVNIGGWPTRFAISLVTDLFSAMMLTISGLILAVCTAFASARREDERPFYHPLTLVLAAGVSGSFLTADLFNLFVFFEVMLIASYVLMTLGATRRQVKAGAVYVTTNLLASTVLVAAVALVYGAVGTVNLAELGAAARTTDAVTVAGALLLVAFGVKAALVPVHGWIGVAYPAAPPAAAALFSGLLTKVGVYALYRIFSVVFEGDPALRGVLVVIGILTMLGGVLAAVGRDSMRDILSFHITSQVGYMILGLGLFGPLGLAAGIFYILHNIVAKTSLFLAAGAVETFEGTGRLAELGGLARRHTVLATAFAIAAFAMVGVPPLSGFFAKLSIVQASFAEAHYVAGATAIVVGFLTLVSMVKIWNGVFWGDPVSDIETPRALGRTLVAPALVLAVVAVVIGFGADGLYSLTLRAAEGLVDPTVYVEAVLGR